MLNAATRSPASYPFALPTAPRTASQGPALQAGSDFAVSVQIDTSGVKADMDTTEAGNRATGIAANRARDSVDMLEGFANGTAKIAGGKTIGTFTFDRSGQVLSRASLDGNGDMTVYGSGSWGGASGRINMFIPSSSDNGGDWLSRASSNMALAAYKLNSVIDQMSSGNLGPRISIAA